MSLLATYDLYPSDLKHVVMGYEVPTSTSFLLLTSFLM